MFQEPPSNVVGFAVKCRRIRGQMRQEFALDYVAAWFLKAGAYFKGSPARFAFVATNSITQGEQVAQLWPVLFDKCGLEITMGHRTFPWGSDARGKAHVHVVIVGLSDKYSAPIRRRLFSYEHSVDEPEEIQAGAE